MWYARIQERQPTSGNLVSVITFAIVGHNEADTIGHVVDMTLAAAGPRDRVIVVDSASTDGTGAVAEKHGVEVLRAPIGKGAAMSVAVSATETEWICFLDADLLNASHNIPALLKEAVTAETTAAHIVGDFDAGPKAILSNTMVIYTPLVAGLFPEIAGRLGTKPLTGFRAVRTEVMPRDLPDGYGVEAHINICIAMAGHESRVIDIGFFDGKFKPHLTMGQEIATAILDLGVRFGRLSPAARPAWEEWVAQTLRVISHTKVPDEERDAYLDRLAQAAARPLPAAS